jgi:hypothetical protein
MRKAFLIAFGIVALFIVASIVTATVYFSTCGRSPLKDQLLKQASHLFPPGMPRSVIEEWTNAQPAPTGMIWLKPGFREEKAAHNAGVYTAYYAIRCDYEEDRCLDHYFVDLYFFFDRHDHLIKCSTEEYTLSL